MRIPFQKVRGWRTRLRLWASKHTRIVFALKAICLFVFFYLFTWKQLDPDFGWHLQSGNYIRAHGIPSHDIFTYTASNFPWVNHEWGNDVIVSLVYGVGGYGLVAGLFAALWSGAFLVAANKARLSVLLLASTAVTPFVAVRSIAWTMLLLAIVLYLLRSKRRRATWLLPFLFMPWANLHAGFVAALCFITYWAAYHRKWKLFAVLPLCVAATFLNGYGPELYTEIGRTLFDSQLHHEVYEWFAFQVPPPTWGFLSLWAIGFVAHGFRPWRYLVRPTVVLLAASLSAQRNWPLFVLLAAPEVDQYATILRQKLVKNQEKSSMLLYRVIVASITLVTIGGLVAQLMPLHSKEYAYPAKSVAYVRTHGGTGKVCRGGNIFNDYQYGGYIVWKLPGTKVYVDGRTPSWKDEQGKPYLDRYRAVTESTTQAKKAFDTYDIRCALVGRGPAFKQLRDYLTQQQHWSVAALDPYSVLLVAPN